MNSDPIEKSPATARSERELADLWERFTRTRDAKLRDQLIEHYMPLVWQNAARLARRLPPHLHLDDLVNAGILGLIEAINRFDHSRNIEFATYGSRRICGAIYDELRELDWLPRRLRSLAGEVEAARTDLTAALGRSPSTEELAAALAVTAEQVEEVQRAVREHTPASLDKEIAAGDSSKTAGALLADASADDPLREAARREIKEVALRGLSETEKMVLTLYYYENLEMREIAAFVGLSESRVAQIHARILKFLRAKFEHLQVTTL